MTSVHPHEPVRVAVVTPVRNGAHGIADTIRSILGQTAVASGRVVLDYTVADGASTDSTVELARRVGGDAVQVVSRSDAGMYDALGRVWGDATKPAEVVAYLNAGDLWLPTALDVVLDVMGATGASWVCGHRLLFNGAGQPTYVDLPFRFRRRLIHTGAYGTVLPHIQQESTFWSGHLLDTVDLERLRAFRLAGDHYLWSCFATETEPVIIESPLGGFRLHGRQLSEDVIAYLAEQRSVTRTSTPADRLLAQWDRLVWQGPPRLKKRLNPRHLVRYDPQRATWV